LEKKKTKIEAKTITETEEESTDKEFPRELLSIIARRIQEVKELFPTRLLDGGYSYKDLEDIDPNIDQKELLEQMVQNGYLEKKLQKQ
tara:strand:- start:53 stop:316 length:264 start_codon:yes stop_codon:yes gene_type:complete